MYYYGEVLRYIVLLNYLQTEPFTTKNIKGCELTIRCKLVFCDYYLGDDSFVLVGLSAYSSSGEFVVPGDYSAFREGNSPLPAEVLAYKKSFPKPGVPDTEISIDITDIC